MKRILIADDHAVTRRGLRDLLVEHLGTCEVLELADFGSVERESRSAGWDLVVLDVMMPGGNVVNTIGSLRSRHQEMPILVLTASSELEFVRVTLQAGANGFIEKNRAADELVAAVDRLLAGESYLHPDTAIAIASSVADPPLERAHERLSPREFDVFVAIAEGKTVKEVAAELELSAKTVATYLQRIREKTELDSHVAIARYAMRMGLVT